MKLTRYFTAFTICCILVSCKGDRQHLQETILNSEATLKSGSELTPDPVKAKAIIALYTEYAAHYPEDTLSAGYLFKAADVSSKINEAQKAIELYGQFSKAYPGHKNAPYALFLQGFIYETQLGDPAKAKPYYEQFLSLYPNHPLAKDVKFSLENLGKSPEDLIREFESRQSADSIKADS
ncbi:MAG TPA: tetratricopeptide repeat protein [Bacteroidia bacterium]|nr:tetratricopeptide repeat protein [Bacteroidia bacterium]